MAELSSPGASEYGIRITRVFNAPRERVWKEWTDPERFADWYGGPEWEVPLSTVTMDVRPGGRLRLAMVGPPEDRVRIDWEGEYVEVEAPARLVFKLRSRPGTEDFEIVTVILTELAAGQTEMLLEQRGSMSPEQYERATEGWGTFFDRLEQRLSTA